MYGYIVGRALPSGTTRMAAKATLAAAITAGRAVSPYATRGAVAAAPTVGRALVNPYIGIPAAGITAAMMTQDYAERSGLQEDINIARDEFIEALVPTARKFKKKQTSVYNRAVSRAVKAVKASQFGGARGKLSSAKKTFGTVAKTVSRVRKGGKVSAKGVTGVIKRSISGMFTKSKQKAKKRLRSIYKPGRLA